MLLGQLQEHLTYLLMKFPGARRWLIEASKAGLESGASGVDVMRHPLLPPSEL